MAHFGGYNSQTYPPSAPSLPESYDQDRRYGASTPPYYGGQHHHQAAVRFPFWVRVFSYVTYDFRPGTHPDVIRSFQIVDSDRSQFTDENELQRVLFSGYQRFNIGTVCLLVFLFINPNHPAFPPNF